MVVVRKFLQYIYWKVLMQSFTLEYAASFTRAHISSHFFHNDDFAVVVIANCHPLYLHCNNRYAYVIYQSNMQIPSSFHPLECNVTDVWLLSRQDVQIYNVYHSTNLCLLDISHSYILTHHIWPAVVPSYSRSFSSFYSSSMFKSTLSSRRNMWQFTITRGNLVAFL